MLSPSSIILRFLTSGSARHLARKYHPLCSPQSQGSPGCKQLPLELLLDLSFTKTTLFGKIPGTYATWLWTLHPERFCVLTLHSLHFLTLASHPDTKCNLFSHQRGQGPQMACLSSELILQPLRHIIKENFQGNVVMGMFMMWFTGSPNLCCKCRKTVGHVYLDSTRLQSFFQLLQKFLLRFWMRFSLLFFCFLLFAP